MAKRTNGKPRHKKAVSTPENALPQNILLVGEHVEENKNIYISQPTYKAIHKFTRNKTTNESGGMLVGSIIEEFGKTNIVISGFIEAKYTEATPTTLTFTHETWEYVHSVMDKKYPDAKILGWIHTHPDFGIFLSEYDMFIQQNFFSEDYQIAYVVDPIQEIEGFYFWINGNIERCKGFYIYDKTGVAIDAVEEPEEIEESYDHHQSKFKDILLVVLTVLVLVLAFTTFSTSRDLKRLQFQQANIVTSAIHNFEQMQEQIDDLKEQLLAQGLIVESEPEAENPDQTDDTSNTEDSNEAQ